MSSTLKASTPPHTDIPWTVLFESAPILAQAIDGDGIVTSVSPLWAQLLGYAPHELVGQSVFTFMTEASRRDAMQDLVPTLINQGHCKDLSCDFLHRDGCLRPVLVSATAELDEAGAIGRIIAFLTDMRATEAAILALKRKAVEADQANFAKSQFLASISHEIRTPMNAILGFAQLLEMTDLPETETGYVKSILTAGHELVNHLHDVLDVSRAEAGYMTFDERRIDLWALLESVTVFWQTPAAQRGLELICLPPSTDVPRWIVADPSRMRQVLNNYLGNAIKFTDHGQIVLRVDQAPDGADDRPRLRFEVSDPGRGIAKKDQDALFAPFVRGSTADPTQETGWGLGLSICKTIANALGGDVGVLSEVGQGARFFFEMPYRTPNDTDADTPLPSVDSDQSDQIISPDLPMTLLVAEDDYIEREILHRMLTGLGHRVSTVSNGFEAVAAVAEGAFDAVLMDVRMPGLDGIGALARIRSLPGAQADVPIIWCSVEGSDTLHLAMAQSEAGPTSYLPKPIVTDQLRRTLRDLHRRSA